VNSLALYSGSELVLELSILEYKLNLKLFKSVKFLGALNNYEHL